MTAEDERRLSALRDKAIPHRWWHLFVRRLYFAERDRGAFFDAHLATFCGVCGEDLSASFWWGNPY